MQFSLKTFAKGFDDGLSEWRRKEQSIESLVEDVMEIGRQCRCSTDVS
jgi:hypothetical protein